MTIDGHMQIKMGLWKALNETVKISKVAKIMRIMKKIVNFSEELNPGRELPMPVEQDAIVRFLIIQTRFIWFSSLNFLPSSTIVDKQEKK